MPRTIFLSRVIAIAFCLTCVAQDTPQAKQFTGTWEARFKGKLICTIRLTVEDEISGSTQACNIQVNDQGDLIESDQSKETEEPLPILNPKLKGKTLSFEAKDDDDRLKFEMTLIGESQAELSLVDAPVKVKPIRFEKR